MMIKQNKTIFFSLLGLIICITVLGSFIIHNSKKEINKSTVNTITESTLNYSFDDFKQLVDQGGKLKSFVIFYNPPDLLFHTQESFTSYIEYKSEYGDTEFWIRRIPTLKELYHQIYFKVMLVKDK
jgi:hypothetical protein